MTKVAFGPEKDVPSWNWVGFDTSRELSKYYDITTFTSTEHPPDAEVIVIIKQKPADKFIRRATEAKRKLIYCPIDFYNDGHQLHKDIPFFHQCSAVLCHCERLIRLILPHCQNTHFVEHNNKFALPEMVSYKDDGFILWVGGCQYIPYLIRWLQKYPIKNNKVKILADIGNERARQAAEFFAREIGMNFSLPVGATSVGGCEVHEWSERTQYDMMMECKAAIDIKLTDNWNQFYKPPTKAQKYVASGIPFAVNPESYSAEYFRTRGFEIASPINTTRWFSKQYWEETRAFGEKLRETTSIEAVGLRFKEIIDRLLYG